jgi:hypothetical protein
VSCHIQGAPHFVDSACVLRHHVQGLKIEIVKVENATKEETLLAVTRLLCQT